MAALIYRFASAIATSARKRNMTTSALFSHFSSSFDEEVDFVKKGYIPRDFAFKDFENCWASSTIMAIEAEYRMKMGKNVKLSLQELLDNCFQYRDGTSFPEAVYQYAMTKGLYKIDEYGTKKKGVQKLFLTDYVHVDPSRSAFEGALRENPLVVCINPTISFCKYGETSDGRKGVSFQGHHVDRDSLEHCMLAAGFRVRGDHHVYGFKNNWGNDWGRRGSFCYMKGADYEGGPLGIYYNSSYPVISGDPWF